MKENSRLAFDINLDTVVGKTAGTGVLVVGGDVDVLASLFRAALEAVLLADADFLTRETVFATWLLSRFRSLFPSSALDSHTFLSLDFSRLGGLVVSVGRGKDAERDSVRLLVLVVRWPRAFLRELLLSILLLSRRLLLLFEHLPPAPVHL